MSGLLEKSAARTVPPPLIDCVTFRPEPGRDFTPDVRAALENPDCTRLVFLPGRYDFRPDRALERYLFVSNNDEGLKRIAFPLIGRDGFAVEGSGANFVFHGGIVPFLLESSQNVTLGNFSIDWEVPFHGEAEVLSSSPQGVEVRISPSFPYRVTGGQLRFGHDPGSFEIRNVLEFDAARRETAFLVHDNYAIGRRCQAEEKESGRVFLAAAFSAPLPQPGNTLAIMSDRRDYPAVVVDRSRDVRIENLTIHHAGGMGIIAQRTENISLHRIRVTPPEDGSRMISTTADATHFVNCRGRIDISDSVFENQMDDPVNVHGIYAQVVESRSAVDFVLRLSHAQQFGVPLVEPGDMVEMVDRLTLAAYHVAKVASVKKLNKEYLGIVLETPPSQQPEPGDAVGNISWAADVEIRGCACRGNRARGFLLSTPGKIVIEENRFHTPGPGILIEGDANFWFESGAVRDVLIRRNRFVNCNFGVWGRAAIQVTPGIADLEGPAYHRNIRIEDNEFTIFDSRIVYARFVDGLTITGNTIRRSDAYPARHVDEQNFETLHCSHVVQADNQFEETAAPPAGQPREEMMDSSSK